MAFRTAVYMYFVATLAIISCLVILAGSRKNIHKGDSKMVLWEVFKKYNFSSFYCACISNRELTMSVSQQSIQEITYHTPWAYLCLCV